MSAIRKSRAANRVSDRVQAHVNRVRTVKRPSFSRMETDREFRKRLAKSGKLTVLQYGQLYSVGEYLDALGEAVGLQRRRVWCE